MKYILFLIPILLFSCKKDNTVTPVTAATADSTKISISITCDTVFFYDFTGLSNNSQVGISNHNGFSGSNTWNFTLSPSAHGTIYFQSRIENINNNSLLSVKIKVNNTDYSANGNNSVIYQCNY